MKDTEDKVLGTEKEFLDIFRELCYYRPSWQVWSDAITMMACSISNVLDQNQERRDQREKEYKDCAERIGGVEKPERLFEVLVMALERNPEQDFLGKMYMQLELGSHWKGQFFTPYSICEAMAAITIGDKGTQDVENNGYVTICDPSCGAGATLIAGTHAFKKNGVNYQRDAMFVGQDIDRIVGMMCYIQLSLLGCPGYIAIANTLSNPIVGSPIYPDEQEGQEFWYTPFYYRSEWELRRFRQMFRRTERKPMIQKQEEFTFFFDFTEDDIRRNA